MQFDPFKLVRQLEPGIMIYGLGGSSPETMRVIFLIKEDPEFIELVKEVESIEIRFGRTIVEKALMMIIMVRFNDNPDLTYDCWFNYYEDKNAFKSMCLQDELEFRFYDRVKRCKSHIVNNDFQNNFKNSIILITREKMEWTNNDFDWGKFAIYDSFSPVELWESLD